jgi:hypothetical protein
VSDARKEVEKMIANRQRKNTAIKNKFAQRRGPNAIVLEFIDAMEKVCKDSKTAFEFNDGMYRESRVLETSMKSIDAGVHLEVIWSQNVGKENWSDLAVEGVKIVWSDFYKVAHPEISKELNIDVSSLLLEGVLK